MENTQLLNFIDLKLEEKEMILKWRNHSEIRKWMYNQDEIKLEEHLNFIDSLKLRKDKLYFLVKKEDDFIGVIDFTQLVNKESVHMGIYSNPNINVNGKILLNKIIEYSFNNLKEKRIFWENYKRNRELVIFDKIPLNMQNSIIDSYNNSTILYNPLKIKSFFDTNELRYLSNNVQDFYNNENKITVHEGMFDWI